MGTQREVENRLVISYLTLRKALGVLGTLLPFVLALGAMVFFSEGIQSSVSSYYYTGMGNVFVGTLCAIGFFLYSYKGYTAEDDLIGNLACISAIGVGIFPTFSSDADSGFVGYIHLFFSALLFVLLAYFCLVLFIKTHPDREPTRKKLQRNKLYRTCGWVILICIVLIVFHHLLPEPLTLSIDDLNPRFWLEAIAIVAFGLSWLVKGEAILSDESSDGDTAAG